MVGTVFERSQCGFYEINNCINKMQFFMLFWNKNGNISFADLVELMEFHDYRLGYKKSQISNFTWNYKIWTRSFPKIVLKCLYGTYINFWRILKILSNVIFCQKFNFLPKFAHLMRTSISSKNWSRHRLNVLRPFLESLGSIFSNSMKFLKFR